ncbi:MAG: hypothetical protein D8M53_07005 [Armatimonadetes bacterium]|nr:MAG: hypothetical protein EDM73_11095 [Armatimonadota bacterium]MBC6970186.1 hypothetical protein [Armatimonadota bacterium]MBL1149938.1 hypothetical protein [Armatimonadota bacterium]MCE7900589.1 hypothetical protein [Armatimonadetes bacterium ATM1]RIJ97135.1 MAG: hypothetical protein DCC45_03600 [Armatimonadota bacterium]
MMNFESRQLLLKKQYWQLFGSNFRIYDAANRLVAFSHQKAFRLREDIRLYSDESKSREVLYIRARQIVDFSAAYDVFDTASGQKVGALKRKGWSSLVRDNWVLMNDLDVEIGRIVEDSTALALLRRLLTNLVPQKFHADINGVPVAYYSQRFNPFVFRMDIEFPNSGDGLLDRRLGLAAAVLLAAIEGRQG